MITESIIGLFKDLCLWVLGLLPSMSVPSWFTGIGDQLTTAFAYGGSMGAWVPWSLAGQVFGFVLVCIGIGFLIKITRIVVSFLLAGGGSAG